MATAQYTNPLALVAYNIAPHFVDTGDISELEELTNDELNEVAGACEDIPALTLEFMNRLSYAEDFIADLEDQLDALIRENAQLRQELATRQWVDRQSAG